MNVCGLFLTLFAALAMAENESILKMASFGTAELTSLPVDTMEPVTIDLGLRAALFNNPNTYGEQLIPFDQFCDLMDRGLEMYMDPKECGECNRVSDQLFTAILIALVAYIPTISTDVLRMYGNYDVNCQKFWAGFMSLFTLAGCVLCYFQFTNACLASFNDGDTSFSKTGILVESGSPFETGTYYNSLPFVVSVFLNTHLIFVL